MSESMSSPWIRDYLVGVAETCGAQIYNAPVITKGKKRIQLADFLTYQEDSYVWAWISDKDYRVSVRISKDAVDEYKSKNNDRSVINCRFSLAFISSYRPMFSPRPLGPNVRGNTPVSHISLEVGYISPIGVGGHLFGNPRDLELDERLKEWIFGLRQDGGGGNVLKLRKQQIPEQNKKPPPSPPSPPPFSLYAPVSQCPTGKVADDATKPKPERPLDLKRAYTKRWRKIEIDPWKLAIKPAVEEQSVPTESSHSPAETRLDSTSQSQSCDHRASVPPSPPRRTPSPASSRRQGTPTDWSLSNRGSPVAQEVDIVGNGIQRHGKSDVLPISSHLLSSAEGPTMDTIIVSDARSLQPPTPAQHSKDSPLPHSSPSPFPSQQLPRSSPPPPSSSLSLPSPSLPLPISTRRNIQRKVPHPGLLPVLDPTKQGPIQILVPNSDPSGTGSSQPYSQSQQSQQRQLRPLSQPPALPISLGFKPDDASTPKKGKSGNSTGRASKMLAESLPTPPSDGPDTTSTDVKLSTEKADDGAEKREGSNSAQRPTQSAPKLEILEVGTSDVEEIDELKLTHDTTRIGTARTQDTGVNHEDSQLSTDDADVHAALQNHSSRHSPHLAATSKHVSSAKKGTDNIPVHTSTQALERPGSPGSMHSLFSVDERTASSQALVRPISRNEDETQERANLTPTPRHDSEAWKEPSFISKRKGNGKARVVDELDTPSMNRGKKRRRSVHLESPVPKRVKAASGLGRTAAVLGQTTTVLVDDKAAVPEKTVSNNLPSSSTVDTTGVTGPSLAIQTSKPRLAKFVVDFERINLGKRVATPRLDLDSDIKCTLLRTGRIRALGKRVENDGSVYIHS